MNTVYHKLKQSFESIVISIIKDAEPPQKNSLTPTDLKKKSVQPKDYLSMLEYAKAHTYTLKSTQH